MTWQELREQYPHRWLVVEAIGAYTRGAERVIEHLEVRGVFSDDWQEAWEYYKPLHHEDKWREYYVLHTDRPALNIGVMGSFGRIITE
jgi:hypothetical protein